jgi:hypothetical protein
MSLASDMRDRAAMLWHVQRVKRMVRERSRLGPHALVSVVEVPCDDPECPGPATQITILGLDMIRRGFLVHVPVASITEADLCMINV